MSRSRATSLLYPLVGALLATACGLPDFQFHDSGDAGVDGSTGGSGTGGTGGTGGSTTGGSGGSAGSSGAAGAGGTATQCSSHADCAGTPQKPKCDPSSGSCVACLPTEDTCAAGSYCSGTSCKPGCKVGGTDCSAPLTCDSASHLCLGCAQDDDCPAGSICETSSTKCVPGCTAQHACDSGKDCCSGSCVILALDSSNCGQCGNVCPTPPAGTGTAACKIGKCTVTCTTLGTQDCNKDPTDGCEVDTKTDSNNCGICGKTCASGTTCANGVCT